MDPTVLTSLSGSLMSLFGLLVSLFSIHLGNWLAKMQALRTKWDINSGCGDKELAVRRECRFGLVELYNWQPFVISVIISGFGVAVLNFFNQARNADKIVYPGGFVLLYNAFFVIMVAFQIFLLGYGFLIGSKLKRDIDSAFPRPARPKK